MNSPIPIYTIGYGNRTLEQFIALLKQYEIAFVADVRSQPCTADKTASHRRCDYYMETLRGLCKELA